MSVHFFPEMKQSFLMDSVNKYIARMWLHAPTAAFMAAKEGWIQLQVNLAQLSQLCLCFPLTSICQYPLARSRAENHLPPTFILKVCVIYKHCHMNTRHLLDKLEITVKLRIKPKCTNLYLEKVNLNFLIDNLHVKHSHLHMHELKNSTNTRYI